MSHVVVFGNQKGGVGKSTLSVLYALWLADLQRQRVCFVDLDTQGNASRSLHGFDVGLRASELFAPHHQEVPSTEGLSTERPVRLISADRKLADIELARPEAVVPAFCKSVARLACQVDAVVIDTPPALGLRMSAALIAATHVVCPIELEEYSIDGVTDMLKTIFGVRQRYNPRLDLAGIVLNRFNPHSVRQKAAMHQLLRSFPDFVVPARISTRSAIPEGLAQGLPVWALAKTSAREASAEVKATFTALQQRIERPTSSERHPNATEVAA